VNHDALAALRHSSQPLATVGEAGGFSPEILAIPAVIGLGAGVLLGYAGYKPAGYIVGTLGVAPAVYVLGYVAYDKIVRSAPAIAAPAAVAPAPAKAP